MRPPPSNPIQPLQPLRYNRTKPESTQRAVDAPSVVRVGFLCHPLTGWECGSRLAGIRAALVASKGLFAKKTRIEVVPRDTNVSTSSDHGVNVALTLVKTTTNLIGIVGPRFSSVSIPVLEKLQSFKLPTISPAATSNVLASKDRFPWFVRTAASNRAFVDAIASFITEMHWARVAILTSSDQYAKVRAKCYITAVRSVQRCV